MEWVLAHMEDADFDAPLEAAAPSGGAAEVDVESISSLSGMGFTDRQATAALKACNGSLERAADWLFSRMDDLDSAVAAVLDEQSNAPAATAGPSSAQYLDGGEDYELVGFISHMGSNTACGHYVCHIKKVRLRPLLDAMLAASLRMLTFRLSTNPCRTGAGRSSTTRRWPCRSTRRSSWGTCTCTSACKRAYQCGVCYTTC